MFNPQAYENSRSDGIGVLEVANGREPSEPRNRQFVPLRRTELKGELAGPLASLRLVQTFGFPGEQADKVLEALYRFPLPGDAAVTRVRVRFGEVDIRAELKERPQAEVDYEQAKQQGRQAALVTRESPDVFTLRVAGIQPGPDVVIETSYVQLARAEGPGWSLRIPLTTAPRYVLGDETTAPHAQGQPLALLRDPGHRFTLDLTLPDSGPVSSPTHRLEVLTEGDRRRVRLQGGEVLPDRDCVLSWRPAQEPERPALRVWLHDDRAMGQVYFLALVAPPATHDRGRGVAREVILLVDHSGSMKGAKWEAADWAVERFLSDLTERDALALGLFHNTTRWFAGKPEPVTPQLVAKVTRFLRDHRDSGGTELGVALEQALDRKRTAGAFTRHVLVITDAEVTDAGRVLRLAAQEAGRADRRRVSVLCIDAAPNALLATELAEQGGGVARFLTSRPEEEDITTALDEVLADWAEPMLTGLRLEVNRPRVEAAGREVLGEAEAGWSAIDLGDLPAGRSVWVAGRVPRGEAADLAFRVRAAKQWEVAGCRLDLAREADVRPALKALFGARRVRGLEYLQHSGAAGEELRDRLQRLGYDPAAVLAGQPDKPPKVYAENVRAEAGKLLRDLLVREALDYGLASAETAFVAVRTEAGKPVEETVVVANALPADWSGMFLRGMAPMAAAGGATMVLACMAAPPTQGGGLRSQRKAGLGAFSKSFDSLSEGDEPRATSAVVFSGVPQLVDDEAVLFDSAMDQAKGRLPEQATLVRLKATFPDGAPKPEGLGSDLCLLLFVEDLAAPRARIRLADLVRQRGERPLNLLRLAGQVLRLILVDPAGTWRQGAPRLELLFDWQVGAEGRI
jgi:Ca-activated chloride channel family protein